jgi:hypothetical protein
MFGTGKPAVRNRSACGRSDQAYHLGVDWYAVRCVFRVLSPVERYVERIALWQADSLEAAIAQAEPDAEARAGREGLEYLGFADAFWTHQLRRDRPDHGDEVFSLMRDSALPPDEYVAAFFTAGGAGPLSDLDAAGRGWYAVRRVVRWPEYGTYEERMTLWRASSTDEAVHASARESREYAEESVGDGVDLELAQCHHLGRHRPGAGDEIFAYARASPLDPVAYLDAFFDTGDERAEDLGPD